MIQGRLVFPPHGSLGDCFIAAGAAHWYADRCERLYFPILKTSNLIETISYLFRENTKIEVVEFSDAVNYSDLNNFIQYVDAKIIPAPNIKPIEINGVNIAVFWDEQTYTHFDLPFSLRYKNCRLPDVSAPAGELFDRVVTNNRYILVSQNMRRTPETQVVVDLARARTGRDSIEQFQVIELTQQLSSNMLFYTELFKHAEEVHCVPSSVFCLFDSVTHLSNAELFYHDLRRDTVMRINNRWNEHRWNIIDYANKL
jgi:hypothetical protein